MQQNLINVILPVVKSHSYSKWNKKYVLHASKTDLARAAADIRIASGRWLIVVIRNESSIP